MNNLDRKLFLATNSLAGKSSVMDAVGLFFAKWLVFALPFAAAVLPASHDLDYWAIIVPIAGIAIGSAAFISLCLGGIMGVFWFRERPFVALESVNNIYGIPVTKHSFPSGHSAAAFSMAFTGFIMTGSLRGLILLVLAALIGFGRVFVGVHYWSDVIVGALVGWISALVVLHLLIAVPAAFTV